MQDPIPPPPALLQSLVTPLATALDLPTLPLHIHEVLAIAALYTFVQLRASPYLARHLLPRLYASFSPRTRASWDIHVVALVQACIISAVAVWVLWHDRDRWGMDWTERVWGYTGADGLIVALAVGYFSWDLMVCTVYLRTFGVGMLAHALSALAVYAFGFVWLPFSFPRGSLFDGVSILRQSSARLSTTTRPTSYYMNSPRPSSTPTGALTS